MRTIHRLLTLTIAVLICLAPALTIGADREEVPGDVAAGDRVYLLDGPKLTVEHDSSEALLVGCPQTALPGNGSTSGNERAPNSNFLFGRSVYLITAAELAASSVPTGLINGIGWTYANAPGVTASGTLVVFLQNTNDTTNTKSTTWATAISGMTTAHNGGVILPATAGSFDIPFSGGSPFTYTGGALYVAFDWQWGGPTTNPATQIVGCTNTLTNGLLGNQSNAGAPVTLLASSFRPETRLTPDSGTPNDVAVEVVYSFGALPSGLVSSTMLARVSNRGTTAQTNVPVTLTVSGAQAFSDTQNVASLAACGGAATVTFLPFVPSANGSDTVTVSVPADDNNPNNSKSKPLDVTPNRYSYKYPGTTSSGGAGFAAANNQIVGRFDTTSASSVSSVTLEFFAPTATSYKVVIFGDNGSGNPGAQLYLDANPRSVLVGGPVTIRLPAPVAVPAGNFYVGIQQLNATNFNLAFDTESPARTTRFFSAAVPAVGWTDLGLPPPGLPFKLNIGAILGPCLAPLTVDVTPNNPSACEGGNIVLTCNVTGGTPNFTYQWTENGIDIGGATNSTHTANHAAGSFTYNCKVTDDGGCVNVQDATASTATWIANGGTCQDGNMCTSPDTCAGGVCQPGDNPCEDNNACTIDVCDGIGGCTYPAVNCDDSNICTTDSCNTGSGCINAPNTLPCDDGNACTNPDACSGGVCVPGPTPAPVQFCNNGSITIVDTAAANPEIGNPYPSSIIVSGAGSLTCSATVSLNGFSHTFTDDVDILLDGPGPQNAIILSDVGGVNPSSGLNITLDDAAGSSLSDEGILTSGTFKPTNGATKTGSQLWPAPAPLPLGGSALSVFTGTNPNGTWNLYVVDDENLDSGSINGGWCVTVVAGPCTLNSQCDDGNACTIDTCSAGQCINTAQATQVTGLRIGTACTGACTDKHTIVWNPIVGGAPYDIIYGDLQTLHSSGLNASTGGCLGDNLATPNSDDGDTPLVDQGFWYLARGRNCTGGTGTYDEGGNQVAPRDPQIPAPPVDCTTP